MNKKIILLLAGGVLLLMGVTWILKDWIYVVGFVRGVGGMALAVLGLVVLMFIKD